MCMCWSEGGAEQWQCHFVFVIRDTIHTAVPWTPLRSVHLRLSQNSRKLHSVTSCPWPEALFTLQFTKLTNAPQCHVQPRAQNFTQHDWWKWRMWTAIHLQRQLSCSNFRQTPIVQYIYDKSLSSTKFQPNRPRNVENKDINSLRS